MTESEPTPAEQTAASVIAAYPGLYQAEPYSIGKPLAAVQLNVDGTARYSWASYEIHVKVGHEDHLNRDDPDDDSLQRQVSAHVALLISEVHRCEVRGAVEWTMTNPRPEILFPRAFAVATADLTSPELASAVLATVALALDYAQVATEHASRQAAAAAEETQWERERPEGTPRSTWLREKRAARSARTESGNA